MRDDWLDLRQGWDFTFSVEIVNNSSMMTQIIYARDAWFNTFRTKKSLTGADSFGYSLYKIVFSERDPTFSFFFSISVEFHH